MVKYQVIEVKDKESCKYAYINRSYVNSDTVKFTINFNIEIIIPPNKNVDYIFLIYDIKEIITKIKMVFEELKKQELGYKKYKIDVLHIYFPSYKYKKNIYDTTKKIIYFKNVDEEFVNFYNNMRVMIFFFNQVLYIDIDGKQRYITNDFGHSFTRIINNFIITDEKISGFRNVELNIYDFKFRFMDKSRQGFFLTNQINPAIEPFYKLMLDKNQQTKKDLVLYSLLIKDET